MEFEEPRAAACEVELLAHAHQTPSTTFVVGHFQVAGRVENGEASTLVRKRLEIRLNKNLDGLFAGTDLDMDGCISKVYLMASPVPSSNDS